jgi:hypothetical protein
MSTFSSRVIAAGANPHYRLAGINRCPTGALSLMAAS